MSAANSSIASGVEIGDYVTINKVFLKCIREAVKAGFVSYARREFIP